MSFISTSANAVVLVGFAEGLFTDKYVIKEEESRCMLSTDYSLTQIRLCRWCICRSVLEQDNKWQIAPDVGIISVRLTLILNALDKQLISDITVRMCVSR